MKLSLPASRTIRIFLIATLLPVVPAARGAIREHAQMKGPFTTVQEVTRACLGCHQSEGMQLLDSSHWTWKRERLVNGQKTSYSKASGLSFFAIQAQANPATCRRCHPGNGGEDQADNQVDASRIDCLVCHDTSGRHRLQADPPAAPQELLDMARRVGRPDVTNCQTCHRDNCLAAAPGTTVQTIRDVHLQPDGAAMRCQSCHMNKGRHAIVRLPLAAGEKEEPSRGCTTCHGENPHVLQELNHHGELISCQACHIPFYGTGAPTLVSWNWLTGGNVPQLRQAGRDGRPVPLVRSDGFTLATKVIPLYRWDNNSDHLYERGRRIDPTTVTLLQAPGKRTIHSQIRPFRVIYGIQLYDAKYRFLISPKLGTDPAERFPGPDWPTIAHQGMEAARLPFSGQYGVTTTATLKRINHGVVPASRALNCLDCHTANSRIPWQTLGYIEDPWRTETDSGKAGTSEQQRPAQPTSPPIEEIILRPGDTL